MTWTTKQRNRTAALLASIALVTAGCSDEVTAPAGATRAPASFSVAEEGVFIANHVKYRNAGAQKATGRSGNATLEVRALRSRDNTTLLEVTTGALDETAVAPGNLAKLQMKALNPDDLAEALWTANYNHREGGGYASYTLASPGRGMPIQVQANITGIDARTDVVTVVETVKLRPDLSPTAIVGPDRARVNTPVSISATVRERNGDVGATANCVLYVDGSEVDRLDGMWVDAAGTVSCAFAHVFTDIGTRALRVAVEGVVPGDWDTANNSIAGSIAIVSTNDFYYYADAFSDVEPRTYVYDYDYTRSSASEFRRWVSHYEHHGREQAAYLNAHMPTEVTFPLTRFAISQSTGGVVLHARSGSDVPATYSYSSVNYRYGCLQEYSDGAAGRVWLSVCSGSENWGGATYDWTNVGYQRWAGDVTYRSSGYEQYINRVGGDSYYYSWNYSDRYAYPFATYGSDYSFSLDIEDGGNTYHVGPTIPLTPYSFTYTQPYGCYDYTWSGWQYRDCYGGSESRSYVYGSKSGAPGSE